MDLLRGLISFFTLVRFAGNNSFLWALLLWVQEAFGDAPRSKCAAADPSTNDVTPPILATSKALYLAIRVGIVVRETSAWITISSRMVCDYAKRRRRRFWRWLV